MDEPPSSPFPKRPRPRDERDTAPVAETVEAERLGETSIDAIAKAQSSAPQVVERMVKLEECLWSLAELLLKVPKEMRAKLAADAAIERAKALLLKSKVMDHNLALDEPPGPSRQANGADLTLLNLSKRLRDPEQGG
jgi:hypothetical protein